MEGYDHNKIEKKWRVAWEKSGLHKRPDSVEGKKNFYLLTEFPYPSGNLHVGHWYAFALPDILARYMRMKGHNVLYPIGFDAFGLPAENAAIKRGLNPRKWTEENIEYMTNQLKSMGTTFDWSREVRTIDPEYYKWTQWMFLQFFKKGLVYRKNTAVNWCPKDKTVLANEQVVDGKCERCDSVVEQKMMLQWNIKITEYADRLIDDLEPLDWPEEIKQSQRNWIGRSEGAEIDFPLDIEDKKHVVFLHGKGGSPDNDFFRWARAELERSGYTVEIPVLPNPSAPDDVEQAEYIKNNCTIDENTIVVGHSAGGLAALRLLERNKIGRLVLIATPYSPKFMDGKERPTVSRSIARGYDFETIKKNAKGILALYDEGDTIISLSDGEEYAKKLGGLFIKGTGTKSHFNGDKEPDVLLAIRPTTRVFTTRPDTLFGVTYLVLAPEHQWVTLALRHKTVLKNNDEVERYITLSKQKSELERMADQKVKTGVKLEGVNAINPATGEKIPLYIADYVLATYGTGAIMAVPAHDGRDFEFAKKFDLPIRQVIEPVFSQSTEPGKVKDGLPFDHRDGIIALVKHWSEEKYLVLKWKEVAWCTFVTGGPEGDQSFEEAARMEIREETGFTDLKLLADFGILHGKFYHVPKKVNRFAHSKTLLFQLQSDTRADVSAEEQAKHEVQWMTVDELKRALTPDSHQRALEILQGEEVYTGPGMLTNSGEFNGLMWNEAIGKFTEKFGRKKTTYKLRDWIVSRQRYWGVPIPIIHCDTCGAEPVPEKDLPIKLPDVEDYLPSGEGQSPLAKVESFVHVICPKCGGEGKRETDTLDTFVDSSWYFLRYTDPKNAKQFADEDKQKNWMPVDLYSGGAEHTTMHLLYSRFWYKALFDLGLVAEPEPYKKRLNRSLIMGPDGQKMSKSRGNVIDPDEVVERLGADTVRMYLAFIGPYNEVSSYPWNPNGVVGVRRFIERVFRLKDMVQKDDVAALTVPLHQTIRKVGEDIEVLKFNTAISQLMIFLNAAEKSMSIGERQWRAFLKLIEPFTPFLADELWSRTGHSDPLLDEAWPSYDEIHLLEDTVTIAVQVNGKTRAQATVPSGSDTAAQEIAAHEAVATRILGKKISKTIVVPGRLVNFVLED